MATQAERDITRRYLKHKIESAGRKVRALRDAGKETADTIAWHQERLDYLRSLLAEAEQDHAQARQRLADHVREGMEALRSAAAAEERR